MTGRGLRFLGVEEKAVPPPLKFLEVLARLAGQRFRLQAAGIFSLDSTEFWPFRNIICLSDLRVGRFESPDFKRALQHEFVLGRSACRMSAVLELTGERGRSSQPRGSSMTDSMPAHRS